MAMKIVNFDGHVAAKIFEAPEHVVYKLCIVAYLVISQKVFNYQHKRCPSRRLFYDHLANKLRVLHKLPDLRTTKIFYFNLFHTHSWECTAQISKTCSIFIQCFDELLHKNKFYMWS